jgi:hypothetical protein
MNVMLIVRYVILVLSALAALCGVFIMMGVLVPVNFALPRDYRIIVGFVVMLYGIYRFVVTFNRPTRP